ncbi:hypothetical protein M1349_05385 [Patescibacteria group bacterium]|nr:hypothetical protein [Patescibacteria group bacterium]
MKILRYLAILSVFLLLVSGFFHKITAITQDLGRHFLLGEIILKTFNVPKTNLFSYTYPNFPFINLHWLSEVIFYIIFKVSGFDGLLIFSTLVVIAAFAIIYFKVFKDTNLFLITISSMLYLGVLFERTDIRPEIFSYLLLSVFIYVLYKNRERSTRLIFLLPFLELLWVNLHIYFIVGIAVIGFFLAEQLLIKKSFKERSFLNLLAVFFLTLIASLFNPNGIAGAIYPLVFNKNYGYTIEENQNIFFLWEYSQKTSIAYFAACLSFLSLSFLLNIKKARLIDLILSIFFIYLATSAIRNFPLFVFGTFIAFVYNFSTVFPRISLKTQAIGLSILIAVIGLQIFQITRINGFGFGIEQGAKNGADFYLKNGLKGPIFNNFDVGGYLDYRFYPKERVFIDNRPGEYPASFFQDTYIPMQQDQTVFNKVDEKYKFNIIFFSYLDQTPWAITFLKNIVNDKKWKIIYLDDYSVILAKDNSQNKNLISKFEINKDKFEISSDFSKDKNSLIRFVVFFNKVGWQNQEISTYQKILEIDPLFCPALYNLSSYYSQQNNPLGNIYLVRLQNSCK